jgi:hypothetical protein
MGRASSLGKQQRMDKEWTGMDAALVQRPSPSIEAH